MTPTTPNTPKWMIAIIILVAAPVIQMPYLIVSSAKEISTMLYIYPLYVLASAYFAWLSYTQRPIVTWILIILMLLSHSAMWILTFCPTA